MLDVRPHLFGTIRRDTYHDVSFHDEDYSYVRDASWEPDEPGYNAHAYVRDNGIAHRDIEWDEDDW